MFVCDAGRGKGVCGLHLADGIGLTDQKIRAKLIAEFKKDDCEKAMQLFNTDQYDTTEDPLAFCRYLERQVWIGLP